MFSVSSSHTPCAGAATPPRSAATQPSRADAAARVRPNLDAGAALPIARPLTTGSSSSSSSRPCASRRSMEIVVFGWRRLKPRLRANSTSFRGDSMVMVIDLRRIGDGESGVGGSIVESKLTVTRGERDRNRCNGVVAAGSSKPSSSSRSESLRRRIMGGRVAMASKTDSWCSRGLYPGTTSKHATKTAQNTRKVDFLESSFRRDGGTPLEYYYLS